MPITVPVGTIVGSILVVVGIVYFVLGRRIARHGVSLMYSHEELRATSGPSYPRVRRVTIVATTLTMLVGAAFLAEGLRGLFG